MLIAIDSDGILTDFVGGVQRLVYAAGSDVDIRNIPNWTPWKHAGLSASQVDWIDRQIARPGFCAGLPMLPGAEEGIKQLQKLGEVFVVTTPWKNGDTWAAERVEWLKKNLGIPRENVVQCKQKQHWHADVFIDDKPSNVRAWRDNWLRLSRDPLAVLWSTPQNQEATDLLRVRNWEELVDYVGQPR